MRQLSLLTPDHDYAHLAGLLPAIRGAMRRAAGAEDGEGRKSLVGTINTIAANGGVRLTTGNATQITKDTLDKWLSPSDTSHPPSVTAIVVFCLATGDMAPLKQVLKAAGLAIATEQEQRDAEYGRACRMEHEAKCMERKAKSMKRRIEENLG